MLKIGLFTFGGGYAMIRLLDTEFVEKKKWISKENFIDLIAIAESTPGPIAINCSTYLGYTQCGVGGSIVATLGVCIPSFVIIYLITLFFDSFLSISWIASAFKGIQMCVIYLILSAGVRTLKEVQKTALNIVIFVVTILCMIVFSLLSINFSSFYFIIAGASIGILIHTIKLIKLKTLFSETKEKK